MNWTPEQLKKREEFFKELNSEYPRNTSKFLITSSGTVISYPNSEEEWKDYYEYSKFVEGVR